MTNNLVIKCRKCRTKLLDSENSSIVSGHDFKIDSSTICQISSLLDCQDTLDSLYLEELGLPDWILVSIEEGDWQKGRLKCPNCSARLGSFDYVSGRKCHCNQFVLPPVHIIKSKIDYSF